MKVCTTCNTEKSLDDFNRKKQCKDGKAHRCKQCTKEWESKYWKNSGKDKKAQYRSINKDKEVKRQQEWRKNNQDVKNFHTAKYRALKKNATPKWLSYDQIEEIKSFYKKAQQLTNETGIEYQVDHIHPLQGKNFSGLHVPWNLQVITKSENLAKSNILEGSVHGDNPF